MKFVDGVQELFDTGEKEVQKWFLVGNNYLPFILSIGYITMSLAGPSLMKNRKPFRVRKIMIVFNFIVVAVYIVSTIIGIYYIRFVPWTEFCLGGKLQKNTAAYKVVSAIWIIYVLKYIEYIDTLFFILRKKENLVSFLHVFHHSIVPLIGWLLYRTEKNGMQAIPTLLNTCVHIIMYTYYGLAAIGPQMKKYLWWKKYLTQMQIVQFVFIILFVTIIAPVSGCPMVITSYLVDIIFAPFFLFLFYRFYKAAFKPIEQGKENGKSH